MSISMPKPSLEDLHALAELLDLKVEKDSASVHGDNPWIQVAFTDNTGTFISVFNGKIVAHNKLPISDEFQKEIPDRSDNHHLWEITV